MARAHISRKNQPHHFSRLRPLRPPAHLPRALVAAPRLYLHAPCPGDCGASSPGACTWRAPASHANHAPPGPTTRQRADASFGDAFRGPMSPFGPVRRRAACRMWPCDCCGDAHRGAGGPLPRHCANCVYRRRDDAPQLCAAPLERTAPAAALFAYTDRALAGAPWLEPQRSRPWQFSALPPS